MVVVRIPTIRLLVIALCCMNIDTLLALTSLAKNDPSPAYTALDPHTFLYTHEKLKIKDPEFAKEKRDSVGLSISPFGQNANRGRDLDNTKVVLGDLTGRWSILSLMFGPIPVGKTMAPKLQTALTNLFPGVAPGDLDDESKIDPAQNFGFFSVPITYKKRGVRFEISADIYAGFGLSIQTGLVSISQTASFADQTSCEDLACPFNPTTPTASDVRTYLMHEWKSIAPEIGLDIGDFCKTSVEEVRANLFWRRGFNINHDKPDWPHFIFVPFLMISGSISPGEEGRLTEGGRNKAFSVPFGNNDHHAIGFSAGLNLDFVDTVELGAEVGLTHFFGKNFEKFRLPTSESQSGVYPFYTDVTIHPGLNWNFGAKLASYHFLERLSGYLQYILIEHCQDDIELRKCEDEGVFLPHQFEVLTSFKVKVVNMALDYDISPNINVGIFAQVPLSQHNAYRSSTLLFSFNVSF